MGATRLSLLLYHFNEERTGEIDHGFEILGSTEVLLRNNPDLKGMQFVLSMGDNKIRKDLFRRITQQGGLVPSLIHPTAVISRFATLGAGVYVSAFTHIQADTVVGENCVILSGVNVSHGNHIGKNCFIAGGATIGAYTKMEDDVFVGIDATTISGKVDTIGIGATIGAGSLVTKSVPAHTTVMGRPAKAIP